MLACRIFNKTIAEQNDTESRTSSWWTRWRATSFIIAKLRINPKFTAEQNNLRVLFPTKLAHFLIHTALIQVFNLLFKCQVLLKSVTYIGWDRTQDHLGASSDLIHKTMKNERCLFVFQNVFSFSFFSFLSSLLLWSDTKQRSPREVTFSTSFRSSLYFTEVLLWK